MATPTSTPMATTYIKHLKQPPTAAATPPPTSTTATATALTLTTQTQTAKVTTTTENALLLTDKSFLN